MAIRVGFSPGPFRGGKAGTLWSRWFRLKFTAMKERMS